MVFLAGSIVCYMGLLSVLAMASPGIGLFGWAMLLVPSTVLDWMHAPAYGLLAWLAVHGLQRRGWPAPYALAVGLLLAFVFGLWTEVAQGQVPGRVPSVKDLLVDAIGICMAGSLVLWQQVSSRTPRRFVAAPSSRLLREFRGAFR